MRCRVADVIRGQIGADDLTADKIKAKVQLAPRAPLALGFMLLFTSFALAEHLQPGAVHRGARCLGESLFAFADFRRFGRNTSQTPAAGLNGQAR